MKKTKASPVVNAKARVREEKKPAARPNTGLEGQRTELMTEALLHLQRRGGISPDRHDEQIREITRESAQS